MTAQIRWVVAACLFGVLFFFAVDNLTESPPTWFDEGIYLQAAMNDSLHGAQVLQIAPGNYVSTAFVTGGYPFLEPVSWSFDLFGVGLLQARAVMVLFILSCAAVFFALAMRLFGSEIALASLALVSTFPPLYGQGKNVLGEVPGLLFLGIFLLCVEELERRDWSGMTLYAVAGLAAGLCLSTKPIFFLLGAAVLIVAFLYRNKIVFRWDQLAFSFAVFCAPLIYWFLHQFGQGDSANAVLHYYANPYGIHDLNAEIFTNLLRFFHESSPMYFALIMLFWTAAVASRIWKEEKITVVETAAFAFAVLVSIAYLRTAGWYRYFFVAEIPALVFLPASLRHIAERYVSRKEAVMWVAISLLLAVQAYQLIFGSWVAVHSARTTAHDMQAYMQGMPRDKTYFVYNTPAAVIFLPTQDYYQYLVPNPLMDLGREELPLLGKGIPDYVVTNAAAWQEASSSMPRYAVMKDIDDFVIASRI